MNDCLLIACGSGPSGTHSIIRTTRCSYRFRSTRCTHLQSDHTFHGDSRCSGQGPTRSLNRTDTARHSHSNRRTGNLRRRRGNGNDRFHPGGSLGTGPESNHLQLSCRLLRQRLVRRLDRLERYPCCRLACQRPVLPLDQTCRRCLPTTTNHKRKSRSVSEDNTATSPSCPLMQRSYRRRSVLKSRKLPQLMPGCATSLVPDSAPPSALSINGSSRFQQCASTLLASLTR